MSVAVIRRHADTNRRLEALTTDLTSEVNRQTQEVRESNETIRALDQSRRQLFLGVSHDLRTTICLILAPIDTALTREDIPAEVRKLLNVARQNSEDTLRRLDDLLTIAEIERHASPINLRRENIVKRLHKLAEAFNPLATSKGLLLNFHTTEQELFMDIDPEKIDRIISNFLMNSIKFTRRGEIQIKLNRVGDTLSVEIEDTGSGIPASETDEILAGKRKSKSGGFGLGIPIALEFIKLHNGKLSLDTGIQGGARFTILFPIVNRIAISEKIEINLPAKKGSQISPPGEDRLRRNFDRLAPMVLIAEDNRELRKFLFRTFSGKFRVRTVANGNRAIRSLLNSIPDVIISDLLMPDCDGFKVLETIRLNKMYSKVPFILLTARSEVESKLQGLSHGADDYITKPFNVLELLARVESLISRRRAIQETILTEREKLYREIHDAMGSSLTDLAVTVDKVSALPYLPESVYQLKDKVRNCLRSLRTGLAMAEEYSLIHQELITAMMYTITRRYTDSGRTVTVLCPEQPKLEELFSKPALFATRSALFAIVSECITNDLRYGHGKSRWRFEMNQKSFCIEHKANTSHTESDRPGLGGKIIRKRATEIGARIAASVENTEYRMNLELELEI
ncbi:MAG: response regulator [Leptospira sp.]|nr:response regulator [Leptospira sp.]